MYSELFSDLQVLLPDPRLGRTGQSDTGLDIHAVGMENLLAGVAYGAGNPVSGASLLCGFRSSRGPGDSFRRVSWLGRENLAVLQGGETFESIIAVVGILRVTGPALRGAAGGGAPAG